MKNKRLFIIGSIVVLILLIPLIAMQFSDEVNWDLMDFVVADLLLFGTGLIFDLMLRKVNKPSIRIVLGITLLLLFFLIWAELAVGIFGT